MQQQQQVILALDIGSSSIRCSAYQLQPLPPKDEKEDKHHPPPPVNALPHCTSQYKISSVQTPSGRLKVYDKDGRFLLDIVDDCIDEVLHKLKQHYQNEQNFQIRGLGCSTLVMNLVAVDDQGQVLLEEEGDGTCRSMTYACNTPRVARECQRLRRTLDKAQREALHQATGAPLHSAYALAQLRALYQEFPAKAKQIFRWQTLASLCLSRWQGQTSCPISYSEASWTGLFHWHSCTWDAMAVRLLPEDCIAALPQVADYADVPFLGIPAVTTRGTTNPYHARWPQLRDDCQFVLGLGDGACANVGSKCTGPSRIAVTIGTSAAARICLAQPKAAAAATSPAAACRVPRGLWCYRLNQAHVVLGGALTDGGSVVEWARQLLNLSTVAALEDCLLEVQALDHHHNPRVTMVPFLSGERSTGYRDGANGCLLGLTRDTTPAVVLKACLESVVLRIRAVVQGIVQGRSLVDHHNNESPPILVVSGAALERNAIWRQMLADATGYKVLMDPHVVEGTSHGVARMVAVALDNKKKDTALEEEPILSPTISHPRLAETEGYWEEAFQEQERLINAISPLW